MARTMTADLMMSCVNLSSPLIESGDYRTQSEVIRESLRLLREKQESRPQALRDMLAGCWSSGEAQREKDAFFTKVKAGE